ncbi:MAG: lipopolysaccharide core heptose(I) kinase RfaP [Proteobacteria bacterium]|nr:lipopolysaccharide core heptose(I) kinase RfaP [Pseudomonadota bacterium]
MKEHYLREDLATEARPEELFQWATRVAEQARDEDVYRNKEGRKTLRFICRGKPYFLKLHTGIGWAEIFKNLLQLRLPVLGARNEYEAVNKLRNLGVDTMSVAAYASEGLNPSAIKSLIVTDDLVGTISLEDYCADWATQPPDTAARLALIKKLADSASRMHDAGINHRDFYLCHFHLDPDTLVSGDAGPCTVRCYLIDLHRAQLRKVTPRRWRVKDLAGLYFSAMDIGLSQRDVFRFMHHYCEGGLREALGPQADIWCDVARRATKLYQKDHGKMPPPLAGGMSIR